VIEPLALGKPVLAGPNIWTIEYPGQEALAAGVLTLCPDSAALAAEMERLLTGPEEIAGITAKAEAFHRAHSGATARIMALLAPVLDAR
jgi:3-deoxy-D-manno-octulosonic-acid transferase